MRESVAQRLNRRRLLTVGGSAAAAALAVDAAGPSTSTSWAADPQLGIINLKVDHGAVGDGTTSDLDAINAAIADLNDGESQALYVPPGQYKMNALADPIIQSNVAIFGAGGSVSEFLHTDGTEGSVVQVGDQASGVAADGVVIASLGLHCENDPTSRRQALLAPNCEDLRVFGVHVQGIAGLCKLGAVATIDAEAGTLLTEMSRLLLQIGYWLLADAELAEDAVEDVVGDDGADDLAQLVDGLPEVEGHELVATAPEQGFGRGA